MRQEQVGDPHDIKTPPALKTMIIMRSLLVVEVPMQVQEDSQGGW